MGQHVNKNVKRGYTKITDIARVSPGIGGEASSACSLWTGEVQCPLGPAGQRPERTHVWPLHSSPFARQRRGA